MDNYQAYQYLQVLDSPIAFFALVVTFMNNFNYVNVTLQPSYLIMPLISHTIQANHNKKKEIKVS